MLDKQRKGSQEAYPSKGLLQAWQYGVCVCVCCTHDLPHLASHSLGATATTSSSPWGMESIGADVSSKEEDSF